MIDLPRLIYCVEPAQAAELIAEMRRDAAGRPLAIDLETCPAETEVERSKTLASEQAAIKGRLKATRKARAQDPALEAEAKLLAARSKYAATAALDPNRARVRLLQAYGGGSRVAVVDVFRCPGALDLLEGADVVGHNIGFDLGHLEAAGVGVGQVFDTMQAARLTLGERAMSLAAAAEAHLGITLDKAEQASDWSAPQLTPEQIKYAARDVVATFRLAERIFAALGPQAPAYEIQACVTPAVSRMQRRGVLIDLAKHADLMRALEAERVERTAEYRAAAANLGLSDAVPKTPKEITALLEAMLTSAELARWSRTDKTGALSTARASLRRAAHYPPIPPLARIARINTLLASFGSTLAALVNPVTGRIHSSYRVAGASTGRVTCSYPNLQATPSAKSSKAFRAIFTVAPGRKIVAGDFASMELRAAAHIARDAAMIAAFRDGVDLHKLTASRMLEKPVAEVTDEERAHAKPINFGSLYGQKARGLVAMAWRDYELVLTETEASEWLGAFSAAYPDFSRWRDEHSLICTFASKIVIGRDAAQGIGRAYPFSRMGAGKSSYTRACNYPIQGACADAAMLALAAIDQELFDAGIDGGPVAWIHDEILLEVPEADAPRAKALLERAMTAAFEETFPGSRELGLLNGLVEAAIGSNWADAKASAPLQAAMPKRFRILDLYCGAGGAAHGLMQAGTHVVGVDILPQPRYCGDVFVQMDALEYLATEDLSQFDYIHASPPCQRYSALRFAPGEHRDADLIGPTREALIKTGLPWCIENVEQARNELRNPVLLCGSMFGLETHPYPEGWRLERHRLFETSFPLSQPACRHDDRRVIGIYGGHFRDRGGREGRNHVPGSNVPRELGFKAMGIPLDSMTVAEISDAIPPAYSKFIAEKFLEQFAVRDAAE
jgi:DNA polymerase I-like protein with 3'-5' exonuclease and polymerase domains